MIKKSVLLFVVFSVIASGLNYLVYPLYARILAPSEYVHITVSLSLFTQISTFLSSIIAVTIGLSKSNHGETATKKIELLQALLFKLFFVLAVVFLLASPLIMPSIHTPIQFALPIVLMMLFSIPLLVVSGYFNGRSQMIKLGLVALITAGSQFVIGLIVALLSRNGLLTMLSITIAQVLTLAVVYAAFSKSQLPGIIKPLRTSMRASQGQHMGSLMLYTILSAVGIMAISLVQIIDLLIAQTLVDVDLRFYTDIYVISRIVFFAGTIFVWPFLAEISLDHHHFNRKPFVRVVTYFAVITMSAQVALYCFGSQIAYLLFGTHYATQLIGEIGILSVLYKFFLLVITAVVLYFVVLRNTVAIWFSLMAASIIFGLSRLLDRDSTILTVLLRLDAAAGLLAILGVILLLTTPIKKPNTLPAINS